MNKKIFINLGVFLTGFAIAMVYNFFYNMNGRYVPFRTTYSNIGMSYLDTRTGKIYMEVTRDGKSTNEVMDLRQIKKKTSK